jgi:ketosteroid isomerase-like protein
MSQVCHDPAVGTAELDTVRHVYDLWRAGDPAVLELWAADAELHPDPESDWPGVQSVYHGPRGAAEFLATISEAFDDYRPDVEEMIDAGDGVVVTLTVESARGKLSGITTTRQTAHIWMVSDARITRLDVIWDRAAALARAGLARRES